MVKMEQLLRLFRPARPKPDADAPPVKLAEDAFDSSYGVLIVSDIKAHHTTVLDWINQNSSGKVQVQIINAQQEFGLWVVSPGGYSRAFFAFENSDDALVFRIKYGGDVVDRKRNRL